MAAKIGLFTGVTILEMGQIVAGPFACNLLGDFGARIIKIEDPGRGDTLRQSGPRKNGQPLWWKVAARNKQSVTVDLRTPAGQALVRSMAARADVVVENFRPGALEGWGLGWDDLHAVNPRLIMLRISGYGQFGPEREKPGFGRVGEAMSGVVYMTGHPDKPPTHFGFTLGDSTTGVMGAFTVAGALFRREAMGRAFDGELIDLALYETMLRMIEWQSIMYDQLGFIPHRAGNKYPVGPSPISDTFETSDGGWVTVASGPVATVKRTLAMIGAHEYAAGLGEATHAQLMERRDEMAALVREWVSRHTMAEVLRLSVLADVVMAKVLTPADMVDNPTFAARENLIRVPDASLGDVQMVGVVPHLTSFPGSVRHTGPELGQHNDEVFLEWLGLPRKEYDALRAEGVV